MRFIKSNIAKALSSLINHKTILISIAHSFFMLILGYVWLGMTYTFGDEAFLIKWTALIKKEILQIDPKPSPGDVLFINTSLSKTEVEIFDDPLSVAPRKVLITDRKELIEFLHVLEPHKSKIKLLVLDILFDLPSNNDSLLQIEIQSFSDKILAASHINDAGKIVEPVIQIPHALATYQSAAHMFFKYPLFYNEQKTLPTAIYEKLTSNKITKRKFFVRDGKMFSLKAPITDFKVRMNDFKIGQNLGESNYALHHLSTINEMGRLMDSEDVEKMFANKLIFLGDFDNDVHKTVFGIMPGLLIVFNAYLTLAHNNNVITIWWLLLILAGFTWISYRILTGKGFNLLHLLKNRFKSGWVHFIIDSLDELFFLSILTVLSYLFFNIHINILVLFVYLKLVEFGLDIIKNKFKITL